MSWESDLSGVLTLPSGRLVRGRGLWHSDPEGLEPQFGIYLQRATPRPVEWPSRWVRWPDWWLPLDSDDARDAFHECRRRAASERVEIACNGGLGRTGTALACIAILDGILGGDAVAYVRRHYHPRAVETPWQRRYVRRFQA